MLRMRPMNILKKPILEKQSIALAFMFINTGGPRGVNTPSSEP